MLVVAFAFDEEQQRIVRIEHAVDDVQLARARTAHLRPAEVPELDDDLDALEREELDGIDDLLQVAVDGAQQSDVVFTAQHCESHAIPLSDNAYGD